MMLAVLAMPAGCILPPMENGSSTGPESEYNNALLRVKEKKYQEALVICRKIAAESPQSPVAADALYEAAYIQAFYDNAQKDYSQALSGFDEYLKRYPEHAKAQDARNWRGVLKMVIDMRKENEHLTKSIEQLRKLDIRHEERRGK